jgi:hypothetical protein
MPPRRLDPDVAVPQILQPGGVDELEWVAKLAPRLAALDDQLLVEGTEATFRQS